MADREIIDSLGRITRISAGIENMHGLLRSLLQGKVGPATRQGQQEPEKDTNDKLDKVIDLLEEVGQNIRGGLNQAQQSQKELENARTEMNSTKAVSSGRNPIERASIPLIRRSNRQDQSGRGSNITKALQSAFGASQATSNSIRNIETHALKKGSLYVHDIHVKNAVDEINRQLAKKGIINPPSPIGMAGMGDGNGMGGGTPPPSSGRGGPMDPGDFSKSITGAALFTNTLNKARTTALGLKLGIAAISATIFQSLGGIKPLRDELSFGDMLAGEMDYSREMRHIGFQTQGITGDTADLQAAWSKTGDTVAQTGKSTTEFQKIFLQQLRRGTRGRAEEIKLTKTSLNLATMIGSSADATADLFHDWHMTMGLTANQMADLSRGIQGVARSSGVTGDNLLNVVKSSERFVKNMKNASTVTAESATNITRLQAEASKRGVGEELSPVMNALSSTTELFNNASNETRNLLMGAAQRTGRTQDVMNGTVLQNPEAMKDIAEGMRQTIEQLLPSGTTLNTLDKLDSETLALVNRRMQVSFGQETGALKSMVESMEEAGKTFSDRLQENSVQLQSNTLTQQERDSLETQRTNMMADRQMDFLSAVDKAAKGGLGLADSIDLVTPKFTKDFDAMGISLTDGVKGYSSVIQQTVGRIKKAGGADLTDEANAALASNDPNQTRQLLANINDEQQKIRTKAATGTDPMSATAQKILLVNESMRTYLGGIAASLLTMVGSTGLIALYAGSGLTTLLSTGGVLRSLVGSLPALLGRQSAGMAEEGLLARLLGRGGAGAANTGENVISGMAPSAVGGVLPQAAGLEAYELAGVGGAAATTTTVAAAEGTAVTGAAAAGGGATAGAGGAAAGGGLALGPVGLVVGAILAVTSVIGGLIGNLNAGAKAAQIFGVEEDKLTLKQYYAAKGAGTLTGILNTLTLGFFNDTLGSMGTATKSLAEFTQKTALLYYPLLAISLIIDTLAGTIKGIWYLIKNIAKGIWKALYAILSPIAELFEEVAKALEDVTAPVIGMNQAFSETGGLIDMISSSFSALGTAIGFVIQVVGEVIGFVVKVITTILRPVLLGLVAAIKTIVQILSPLFGNIMRFLSGLGGAIAGLFTLDAGRFFTGIGDAIAGLAGTISSIIVGILLGLPRLIVSVFGKIFEAIGSAADGVTGPLGTVLRFSLGIFTVIGKIATAISDTLGGVSDLIIGLVTFDGDMISRGFDAAFMSIPRAIVASFSFVAGKAKDLFGAIPDWLIGITKAAFVTLPTWIVSTTISALGTVAKAIWDTIMAIPRMILTALKAVFVEFPTWLYGLVTGAFSAVGGFFSDIASSALDALKSLAGNAIIGPIFQPFLDLWNTLSDTISSVTTPLMKAFKPLIDLFVTFKNSILSIFGVTGDASDSMISFGGILSSVTYAIGVVVKTIAAVVGVIIRALAEIIGFVLKIVIFPLQIAIRAIGAVLQVVIGIIKSFVDAITPIISGVLDVITGIVEIIVGIFTLNGHKIWDGVKSLFGGIYKALTGVVMFIPNLIGGLISNIGNIIGDIYNSIVDYVAGIFTRIGDVGKAIWDFLTSIPSMIASALWAPIQAGIDFVSNIFSSLWSAISTALGVVSGLFDTLWSGVATGIGWIGDLWNGVTDTVAAALYYLNPENWLEALSQLGPWLYDTATGAFSKVWDWLVGLIPGASTVMENSDQFAATRQANGDSLGHGAMGMLSGAAQLDAGKVWEGTKETTSAVASALNPFNWFGDDEPALTPPQPSTVPNNYVVPANTGNAMTNFNAGVPLGNNRVIPNYVVPTPNGTIANSSANTLNPDMTDFTSDMQNALPTEWNPDLRDFDSSLNNVVSGVDWQPNMSDFDSTLTNVVDSTDWTPNMSDFDSTLNDVPTTTDWQPDLSNFDSTLNNVVDTTDWQPDLSNFDSTLNNVASSADWQPNMSDFDSTLNNTASASDWQPDLSNFDSTLNNVASKSDWQPDLSNFDSTLATSIPSVIRPTSNIPALEDTMDATTSNIANTGNIGQTSIPSAIRGETVQTADAVQASAVPISDVYDRVREERAGQDTNGQTSSREMSDIAWATGEQVRLLGILHEDLEDLKNMWGSTSVSTIGRGGNRASTRTQNNQSLASTEDGRWQATSHMQNATLNTLNEV